jgi:hypothetical protein
MKAAAPSDKLPTALSLAKVRLHRRGHQEPKNGTVLDRFAMASGARHGDTSCLTGSAAYSVGRSLQGGWCWRPSGGGAVPTRPLGPAAVSAARPRGAGLATRASSISAVHIERTTHPVSQGDVSARQRDYLVREGSNCRPSAFQVNRAKRCANLQKRTSLTSGTTLGGRCENNADTCISKTVAGADDHHALDWHRCAGAPGPTAPCNARKEDRDHPVQRLAAPA